jgi:hypothetical protein
MRVKTGIAFIAVFLCTVCLPLHEARAQGRTSLQNPMASGTAGLVFGQVMRLSVANIGVVDVTAKCGPRLNPLPIVLFEQTFVLGPGEARDIDLSAEIVPREHFDSFGRAQIRMACTSTSATLLANLEVFDLETGKTTIIVPLQATGLFTSP